MFFLDKIRKKLNRAMKDALSEDIGAYKQRLALLTTLEYKVFMLLREGFSKKECSRRLNMGRCEVRNHARSIYSKLKVRNVVELIVKYRKVN